MFRKTLLTIVACLILSILLVFILYVLTSKASHPKNGFIRTFRPNVLLSQNTLDIKFNSFYIAGLSSRLIYLGNYTAPTYVLVSNYELTDTHHIRLKMPFDRRITGEGLTAIIDSPNVNMIDRITTSFFCGRLQDSCIYIGRLDTLQFSKSMPLSSTSVVLRTFDKSLRQDILMKAELSTNRERRKVFKLDKHTEGIFSVDGMIHYNQTNGQVVYVYCYRNQFVILDTNLNLLYKGNTIDTISTPHIKVAEISSEKVNTLAAPPLIVNKKSCVFGNWLFINSDLIANNEKRDLFNGQSVIDVYSLLDSKYKFSFYLPDFYDKKITDFRIFNKTLVALYDHFILTYQLNF